jgi:plasmid maintenance system antidote protein VapI
MDYLKGGNMHGKKPDPVHPGERLQAEFLEAKGSNWTFG